MKTQQSAGELQLTGQPRLKRSPASMSVESIPIILDNASLDWAENVNRTTIGESKFCFYRQHAIRTQLKDGNATLRKELSRVDYLDAMLDEYLRKAERFVSGK